MVIINFQHPAMTDPTNTRAPPPLLPDPAPTSPGAGGAGGGAVKKVGAMAPAAACVVRLQAAEIRDCLAVIEAEIDAMPPGVRGLVRSRLAKAQHELSEARKVADRFARARAGDLAADPPFPPFPPFPPHAEGVA